MLVMDYVEFDASKTLGITPNGILFDVKEALKRGMIDAEEAQEAVLRYQERAQTDN